MLESDATIEVEDDPSSHDLHETNTLLSFDNIRRHGLIIVLILGLFYLVIKKLRARLVSASNSSSSPEYSAEDEIRRREAVEAARMRLQERFNEDLKKYKEKKLEREKEEAMRRAEEWSLLQSGKSCSGLRRRVAEEDKDQTETDTKRRDKPKPRFRINDYNPLMGDTSGSRFRPSCRPTSGGG
ncbi:unnamed protein product [Calicophoron daubneyi]|uniref:Selenoprotein S n=1 Tax=Calicophoron daubneyi TaxID=300641 RepID=A0AAV2TU86_CALDB